MSVSDLEAGFQSLTINKGTGAGGSNTTVQGKKFEDKTDSSYKLLELGYEKRFLTKSKNPKKYDYLFKKFEDKTVIFTTQHGFKKYIKKEFKIDLFRVPDEAYIILYNDGRKAVKILEKKAQNGEGSVETKLWAAGLLRREYQLVLGNEFEVQYALCVNKYFQNKFESNEKKYTTLNDMLKEINIDILFGDDENYFEHPFHMFSCFII